MDPLAIQSTQFSQLINMTPPVVGGGPDAQTKAAEEFEATYLATVFDRMFASIPTDGPFGGGNAEATWRSFLAKEYAGEVVGRGGIGLADSVRAELIGLQEVSNP
ncbi:hypothetical protein MNBD_ALPHA09-705 [hydrothermal vent metagenome]|uniref:Flagellar protein FlgJ N-terminal domain-containing protein n=1 Tax=hydrothermal vent metagenome TaxID=652676 RepID=A0A3B0T376_9ZZZZ